MTNPTCAKYYDSFDKFVKQSVDNWNHQYKIFDDPIAQVLIGLFKRQIPISSGLISSGLISSGPISSGPKTYYDRLATEITLVIEKDFVRLFLQVRELLDLIDENVPHIIRGSSGSSLICYLMGITDLDPVYYSINLARFMHERRTDFPDVDIDFPWNIRDSIFKIIHNHWGNKVGRVSNHVHYHHPSALRQAIRETKDIDTDIDTGTQQQWISNRTQQLLGQLKGHSLHCGGIVIFDEDIPDHLILKEYSILPDKKSSKPSDTAKQAKQANLANQDMHARSILNKLRGHYKNTDLDGFSENKRIGEGENTRIGEREMVKIKERTGPKDWGLQLTLDKFEIEKEGYIKIDILSNRGLGQLWDIEKRHLSDYDYSDLKTYEILSKGEVIGLTYSESRAMMKIFMEMKPRSVDHIAEALALVRPSASQNYQKSDYLKNFHLILNSIETRQKYLIYDDDAIDYIQRVLKVNESIADTFRKAFAKNDKEKKYEFLVMLAKANPELSDDERIAIHDQLNRLNTYSFCKSHAYSYARLVYALAYHKVHNPQKFWLAALNNCQSSFRRWVHFREASLSGIELVYGRGPWIFDTSDPKQKMVYKLKPIKSNKSKNEEASKEGYDISVAEGMLRWKYWIGPLFYPGMYYRSAKLQGLKPSIITDLLERCCDAKRKILKTLVLSLRSSSSLSSQTVKDTVKVAFFKGLIACNRYHRTDKHDKRDGYLITFCTIGYDNGCYVDLIIDRLVEMKHEHFIEGAGIIKPGNPICIDVFWYRLGKITEPHKDFSISYKTNINKKPSNYNWNDFLQLSHELEYESDNDSDDYQDE